jgi:hypothetical protein
MLSKLRPRRPSHGTIVAYLALFVALGGSAYAVAANSVGTAQLQNGAVTNPKLATSAVGSGKIADQSIKNVDLSAGVKSAYADRCPQYFVAYGNADAAICISTSFGYMSWTDALNKCRDLGYHLASLAEVWTATKDEFLAHGEYWTSDNSIDANTPGADTVYWSTGSNKWAFRVANTTSNENVPCAVSPSNATGF